MLNHFQYWDHFTNADIPLFGCGLIYLYFFDKSLVYCNYMCSYHVFFCDDDESTFIGGIGLGHLVGESIT